MIDIEEVDKKGIDIQEIDHLPQEEKTRNTIDITEEDKEK